MDPSTPQLGGYHLIASDEFSESLDGGLFLDDYLPHWSTGATRADYDVVDGHLRLIMRKDRQEWDPAYDSGMRISSVQTYERNDLHRWTNYPGTARDVVPFRGHLQKYGHFELRARMAEGGGSHCAWWMIGANQDQPEGAGIIGRESGEVDIFEVLGKDRATGGAFSVHAWRDHFGLFPIKQSFVLPDGASFADDFHVFEFDWDARGMRMAIDGVTVASTRMTVGYPMMTLLGIYDNLKGGWTGPYDPAVPYPKYFEIDYFRAYQETPSLPYELTIADGYLRGQTRSDRWVTRWLGGDGNDATLANVWVPEDGEYTLTFSYRCAEERSFRVLVAGLVEAEIKGVSNGTFTGNFSKLPIKVRLSAGVNSITVDNPDGPAPDFGNLRVDY
ncbi:family 16 glycosylhydrolase [Actinomyces sp.]|uniref:family 16 glycosylhydrolase n=1 Tax=Actinomyces sp. TaxID=29317 RepID=UPI0026DD59ED|nr:family 16 glycosylhydrolase [Actinomyces sp.]MDO4900705.1 family 16 glycosylhydrolase [Actinomyces sp.]